MLLNVWPEPESDSWQITAGSSCMLFRRFTRHTRSIPQWRGNRWAPKGVKTTDGVHVKSGDHEHHLMGNSVWCPCGRDSTYAIGLKNGRRGRKKNKQRTPAGTTSGQAVGRRIPTTAFRVLTWCQAQVNVTATVNTDEFDDGGCGPRVTAKGRVNGKILYKNAKQRRQNRANLQNGFYN